MKNFIYDNNHPVAVAVEPLRQEAVKHAEKTALEKVKMVQIGLSAVGMDRQQYAPHPYGHEHDYFHRLSLYHLVRRLTKSDTLSPYSRRLGSPDPCLMIKSMIDGFVDECKENAGADYTAFIYKLIQKVDVCVKAELEGSHVWGFSILTVYKRDTVERWKTHHIVNVSKHGKLFNQWPSRKIK